MSQTPTAPRRDWLHYLIVIALAGVVGTGSALFITSRHADTKPSTTTSMNAQGDGVVNPDNALPTSNSKSAPSAPPTTDAEPPPMLAGNMPAPQAALTLGNWYFDHQNWKKAIEKYEEAIQLGINNPNIRTDLGSAYRFSGNAQKALEEYQYAHKMDPKHQNSLFNQGAVYVLMLKNPQKGIAIWKEYLKEFPNGDSADHARKLIAQAEQEYKIHPKSP